MIANLLCYAYICTRALQIFVQFYIIKTRSKDLNGLKNYLHINGEGNEKYIKFKRSSVTRQ